MKYFLNYFFKGRKVTMNLNDSDINVVNEAVCKIRAKNSMDDNETIDIIKFAIDNGFIVQTMNMGAQSTGMLLVDENNYINGTNTHKLIVVKKGLSEEQIRFIVAHELGHYFLSGENKRSKQLAHREYVNLEKNEEEHKADYFALAFLMPENGVYNFVNLLKNNGYARDKKRVVRLVAALFNVTEKKAIARLEQLQVFLD